MKTQRSLDKSMLEMYLDVAQAYARDGMEGDLEWAMNQVYKRSWRLGLKEFSKTIWQGVKLEWQCYRSGPVFL